MSNLSEKRFPFVEMPIEELAKTCTINNDVYSKEESEVRNHIVNCEQKLNEDQKKLSDLGAMMPPESEPNRGSYLKTTAGITSSIWLVALILLLALHCLIWFVDIFVNVSWDTWGWVCSTFKYGLIGIIASCVIAIIVHSINHDKWSEYNERYNKWRSERERLKEDISVTERSIAEYKEFYKKIDGIRRDVLLYLINDYLGKSYQKIVGGDYTELRKLFFNLQIKKQKIDDDEFDGLSDEYKKIYAECEQDCSKLNEFCK